MSTFPKNFKNYPQHDTDKSRNAFIKQASERFDRVNRKVDAREKAKSYSSALDLARARTAKAKAKKSPESKEEHNKQQSRIADQFSR